MKTTGIKHEESVHIDEEFIAVDSRPLDSRHRVTLSDAVYKTLTQRAKKIDSFEILVGKNGSNILLRPKVSVPADEAWVYETPKVLNKLRRAMRQVKEGKVTKVKDQQKFFDSL